MLVLQQPRQEWRQSAKCSNTSNTQCRNGEGYPAAIPRLLMFVLYALSSPGLVLLDASKLHIAYLPARFGVLLIC